MRQNSIPDKSTEQSPKNSDAWKCKFEKLLPAGLTKRENTDKGTLCDAY